MTSSPTVKRRRLSAALRELRIAARLEPKEAAKRLEWDQTKVHRIERNKWVRPDPNDIKMLLDLYGVTDPRKREGLLALARESRQRGWWADYSDMFRGSLPDFEAGAAVIQTYEMACVPGLLQTEAYARAIIEAAHLENDVDRRVQARLARQAVLSRDNPPQFWAVIDEAALRRIVGGPTVMAEQLRHIIKVAEQPNVAVQVLPFEAGAHAALMGAFVILDFESELDSSLVYVENETDALYLEEPPVLHRYNVVYSHVQSRSLSPEESLLLMESLAEQLQR
ncbi:helix-turn-helix domain-containing protein [Streptosporangium roseum]|uniref:helix-turn-helix domain-containing protein n=1 Tax=Streptosporangium roseum TaxID=2001 RepID=UPI0004CD65C6|nr:helix-turn-helix transcriptional regulator [Streptosporangium roseum]